uniref:Uncharacterized protein MANES_04G022800 n=1 Tax=Rhizophora mucronata TaxID=61149 RepID=A0A2P2JQD4_RHIMU
MASDKKPKKEDEEAKKNNNKKNNNGDKNEKENNKNDEKNKSKRRQTASASKSTNKKTPTKPNQDKKNGKKTNDVTNGKASEHEVLIISSSSCESQEVEESGEEEREESKNRNAVKNSKTQKSNKRKEKENEEEGEGGTMCRFPMARIKRIIKSEDPSLQLGQDVVFLVNKATEKFLEQFCEEAYECLIRDQKKSLGYKHLSSVVSKKRRFDFLSGTFHTYVCPFFLNTHKLLYEHLICSHTYVYFCYCCFTCLDFVPEKLRAEDALAESKLAETG